MQKTLYQILIKVYSTEASTISSININDTWQIVHYETKYYYS